MRRRILKSIRLNKHKVAELRGLAKSPSVLNRLDELWDKLEEEERRLNLATLTDESSVEVDDNTLATD